jgi:AcrR family transcriptional regulator
MASSVPESLTPRARQIVATARELLESEGSDALSMRRIATALSIKAPSLYKHVPDKRALEAALISDGFAELAAAFERADGRLEALAAAYRAFATAHPHLYRLMTDRPLPRERLAPGVEDRAAQPIVDAVAGDPHAARAVWAFAHGMTILELNERFPAGADLDAAWRHGIAAFAHR